MSIVYPPYVANAELVLVDHASGLTGAELQKFCNALERQLGDDVAPAWGRYAVPWVAKTDEHLADRAWRLHLWKQPRDASDAGMLGFHETRGKDHVPEGHVFVELVKSQGENWTVIASHEAVEMVGDEWINLEVVRERANGTVELWPRELCDAVQGLTYRKLGVELSDFVLPEYFIDASDGPYDFMKNLTKPFSIHGTGYSSVRFIKNGKVTQRDVYGHAYAAWRRAARTFSRKSSRNR